MRREFQIDGKKYSLTTEDVRQAARSAQPKRIRDFYVEVDGRRFPPTQLVRLATGAPRVWSFNSRSILTKLGFQVKAQQQ